MEIRRLKKADARRAFRSGDPSLDTFFHRYAGQNQFRHHVGVSYVAVEGSAILGYVTVSVAHLEAEDLPSGLRAPRYPLPVLRIARLAVAERTQGQGIGSALLGFSVHLALRLRDEYGCVGLLTDAKPGAVAFYARHDFESLGAPTEPGASTLMFLSLTTAAP